MKYFIYISVLFFGCKESTLSNNRDLTLKLSKKELTKIFKGQELYSIKGLKSKFEDIDTRVKSIYSKEDYILHLDFKNSYFEGSKELILHSNLQYFNVFKSLKWYIDKNKLIWSKTELITINFKKGLQKNFVLLSIPNKESIEYGEKRFVQQLSYFSKKKMLDIEESETSKIIDYNSCYDYDYKSLVLLYIYLKETGITLNSTSSILIIPNPITNHLEFLIDFSEVSVDKLGIDFDKYKNELSVLKRVDSTKFNIELEIFNSERELNKRGVKKINKYKEVIFRGVIDVYKDTILSNVDLKIEPNTRINLFNNSKIIINKGIVSSNGIQKEKINVIGHGENSILISNVESCVFNYTNFSGLSNWLGTCKTIPSAFTIYNSNSEFNSCEFRNNKRGDDMINLFSSKFIFNDCLFENILSDALDSDFSQGNIVNSIFSHIGNDAVDCSGSKLEIINSIFIKVKDKAISAGENSNITVSESVITDSAIGYVSKDGSVLNITGFNKLENNDLDFVIFIKKPFYKKPKISFNGKISNYKYLLEEKCIVESQDLDLSYLKNVQSKLYGNEYGKSSK
tara:strand:+ start:2368 stop:4074 length:1707 start_codon:yes stop_codon:yes gene_type:complete